MSRRPHLAILVALTAATALLGAACSDGADDSQRSTSSAPSTSAPPGGQVPEDLAPDGAGEIAQEEPPEPAWVVQVGSPENDVLSGVTGRNDTVLAVGETWGDISSGSNGSADIMTLTVDTEGEVQSLTQAGGELEDQAQAVSNGTNSEQDGVTIACGRTGSALSGPNSGQMDAWCGTVGETDIESFHQQGSPQKDQLVAVAVNDEAAAGISNGAVGYAAGTTDGFFPGASDTSSGSLGGNDALLWKIDSRGFPIWIRQFGTQAGDEGAAVAVTSDGDGVIAGHTEGNLDGPSNGASDAFVARFDGDGLPRWTMQVGSAGADWANGVTVGGNPTEGTETIVMAGGTTGEVAPVLGGDVTSPLDAPRADGGEPAPDNAGGTDALISAFDSTGDALWNVQLGTAATDDAIAVTSDGQTVLVAGNTSGTLATDGSPGAGGGDGFLAAIDRDTGTLRWVTQFGSPGNDVVSAIAVTEDGLVVISGTTDSEMTDQPNAGGTDGYLIAFPLPSAGGAVASSL